jgi:hypothetical protein
MDADGGAEGNHVLRNIPQHQKLFWLPVAGWRWRIDWRRTNRSRRTDAASG